MSVIRIWTSASPAYNTTYFIRPMSHLTFQNFTARFHARVGDSRKRAATAKLHVATLSHEQTWILKLSYLQEYYHRSHRKIILLLPFLFGSSQRGPGAELYRNGWSNRAGFWHRSFHPTLCCKKIRYLKIRTLPPGTLPQTLDLENFATANRSCCQQNSSTVELVD